MYTEGAEERREWARAKADHKEKRRAPEAVHQLLSVYGIDICVYTTRTAILVLFAMLIFWPRNFFFPLSILISFIFHPPDKTILNVAARVCRRKKSQPEGKAIPNHGRDGADILPHPSGWQKRAGLLRFHNWDYVNI